MCVHIIITHKKSKIPKAMPRGSIIYLQLGIDDDDDWCSFGRTWRTPFSFAVGVLKTDL